MPRNEWASRPLEDPPTPEAAPGNVQVDGSVVHSNPAAARKAEQEAVIKSVARVEAKTVPGAPVLTPKGAMLTIPPETLERHADAHLRFIATRDPNKLASRKSEGYQILPESEGGIRLGDGLALAKNSKRYAEDRRKAQEEMNRARLQAAKNELASAVESVVREMRNRGIDVSRSRILIDE